MTIAITRLERSAADLRAAAGRTQDAPVARRMLAIALVLEGWSRDAAAEACAMERQTLRDWVHRYNELGLAGLSDRPRRNGPPPRLSAEQQATVKQWVEQGPDLERDGVVRWRCVDLQRRIKAEFTVHLHERSVGKLLRRLDFTRLQPRPYHPKKAAVAQETFKRDFTRLAADALPPAAAGKPLEIWFEDEARVGQQGSLTYVWAARGSRPPAVRDNRHDSVYLFGAVCPERGIGAAIIMPAVNSEAMAEHLREISSQIAPGAHAVLVLDGAGWHQPGERLPVPDNISLLPLPAYSPELNPVENIWEFLRGNFLSHRVWDTYDAIIEACRDAWNKLMQAPERIRSIAARAWAKPVIG